MKTSYKKAIIHVVSIAIIVTIIGIYVYTSYFHYYEGRNNKQNEAAKRIYDVTSYLIKTADLPDNDLVLSSNKKMSVDVLKPDFYRSLQASLLAYDIDLNKQVFYIEIRDGKYTRLFIRYGNIQDM